MEIELVFRHFYHSSIQLPPNIAQQFDIKSQRGTVAFRISSTTQRAGDHLQAFVSWNGGVSTSISSDGKEITMEIDKLFGLALGFKSGQKIEDIGIPKSVSVEPLTVNDWEIIERNSGAIEETLLQQVSIVKPGQIIFAYVHNRLPVSLLATEIATENLGFDCYKLQADVELFVMPKLRKNTTVPKMENENMDYRTHSRPTIMKCKEIVGYEHACNVILPESSLIKSGDIVKIASISFDKTNDEGLLDNVHLVAAIDHNIQQEDHVYIPSLSFDALGLRPHEKCLLEPVKDFEKWSTEGEISFTHLVVDDSDACIQKPTMDDISDYMNTMVLKQGFAVTSGTRLYCNGNLFKITIKPKDENHLGIAFVNSSNISKFKFTIHSSSTNLKHPIGESKAAIAAGRKDFISTIVENVENIMFIQGKKFSGAANFVIEGIHGCGKSEILKCIAEQLESSYYVRFVDCSNLIGSSKFEQVQKRLCSILETTAFNEPSILILDDFDILLMHIISFPSLMSLILDTLHNRRSSKICTILSVQKTSDLNEMILASVPIVKCHLVPSLTLSDRELILQHLLPDVKCDMKVIADRTDGYLPEDLQKFCHQVKRTSYNKNSNISLATFEHCLKSFSPASLSATKIEKPQVSWNDVRGMFEVKKELLKNVNWPLKYREIYAKFGFNMKSGILLYGPSGCGKSTIVPALAHECNLNLISVNAPELLDKYIGTSEESIRDLFQRARIAAPCLLFFDEFDVISARRGSDNAGTTDRIVNQLLTELDGADELEGVIVIAASSKPEIIDPALLRPGRLDVRVLVGFPNTEEREDILEHMGSDLDLHLEWKDIAAVTSGWTCADLAAVFSNTRMEAAQNTTADENYNSIIGRSRSDSLGFYHVHIPPSISQQEAQATLESIVESRHGHLSNASKERMKITRENFEKALAETFPSHSEEQSKAILQRYIIFKEGKHARIGTDVSLM